MKTLGEKRVRTDFNVTNDDVVTKIKEKSAELINLCQAIKNDESVKPENDTPEKLRENAGEIFRLVALAQTAYEEAAKKLEKGLISPFFHRIKLTC